MCLLLSKNSNSPHYLKPLFPFLVEGCVPQRFAYGLGAGGCELSIFGADLLMKEPRDADDISGRLNIVDRNSALLPLLNDMVIFVTVAGWTETLDQIFLLESVVGRKRLVLRADAEFFESAWAAGREFERGIRVAFQRFEFPDHVGDIDGHGGIADDIQSGHRVRRDLRGDTSQPAEIQQAPQACSDRAPLHESAQPIRYDVLCITGKFTIFRPKFPTAPVFGPRRPTRMFRIVGRRFGH